jgi:hypothetical protein
MTDEPEHDALLSPGEAAAFLGISRQRLTQLREKGQVRAIRMGHFWVYPRSSLEQRKAQSELHTKEEDAEGNYAPGLMLAA